MSKQAKQISKTVLERIDKEEGDWYNGNQVIEAEITYRKEGRPRGYYLHVSVYRDLDNGGKMMELFGDPSKYVLLQEAKAFSQKTLDGVTVSPEVLACTLDDVTAKWQHKRDVEAQETKRRIADEAETVSA